MSLILDALRKLERERDAHEPGVLVVGSVPWGETSRRRRLAVWAGAALALGLAVLLGWLLRRSPEAPAAAVEPRGVAWPSPTASPSVAPANPPASPQPDRLLAGGSVDHVLNGTKDTVEEARATLKSIRTEMDAMKLKETSGRAQRLLESLETDSRRISADLKETAGNLRQVSENLEGLVDRVQADPSEILFSSAPSPRPRVEIKP